MLIRHTLSYLFARGLPGIINFAALAVYTRLLTAEDFGRYSMVMVGIGLVHVMTFQWLLLVCSRFLPAHAENPKTILQPVLAIFFQLSSAFVIVACIATFIWATPEWHVIAPIAILLVVVQAWHELNLRLATVQLAPGRYAALGGIKAMLALLLGALFALEGWGANAPLVGMLIGSVAAWLTMGRNSWVGVRAQLPNVSQLKDFGYYGLPLALTFSLVWITSSSDRLMIVWYLGEVQAGFYAVGYDLAQHTLGLLLTIVNTAATPLAIRALEKDGVLAASQQMRQNGELIFALAFSSAAGMIAIAPGIIGILVGEAFREGAISVFPWIALSAAVVGIKSFHFDIAFHLTKKSKWLLVTSGLAAISNLGLNLMFIPRFGIVGAAWAALLAYSIAAICSAIIGFRVFPMPQISRLLMLGFLPAIFTFCGAWVCMQMDMKLLPKMVIAILVGGSSAAMSFLILNVAGLRQLVWKRLITTSENKI